MNRPRRASDFGVSPPKKSPSATYQADLRCLGDSICHCAGRASPWRKCVPTGENEEKNPRLPQ